MAFTTNVTAAEFADLTGRGIVTLSAKDAAPVAHLQIRHVNSDIKGQVRYATPDGWYGIQDGSTIHEAPVKECEACQM